MICSNMKEMITRAGAGDPSVMTVASVKAALRAMQYVLAFIRWIERFSYAVARWILVYFRLEHSFQPIDPVLQSVHSLCGAGPFRDKSLAILT